MVIGYIPLYGCVGCIRSYVEIGYFHVQVNDL